MYYRYYEYDINSGKNVGINTLSEFLLGIFPFRFLFKWITDKKQNTSLTAEHFDSIKYS